MTAPLRIAIAGLGTVGTGVIDILEGSRELLAARAGRAIEIVAVSARDKNKTRAVGVSRYRWADDPKALAAADTDVVVELMGGAEGAARALVEAALQSGKHVVTANKALIATHGAALARAAENKHVALLFEAAVAGGIPILKLLREGLAGNRVNRIMGILNGTCNYILTHMKKDGRSFEDVLAEAQKLGYAEADPTFDIDGIDTAHKLAILTSLAFGTLPDLKHMHTEGIRGITAQDIKFSDELGYTIKLLGIITPSQDEPGKILQRVYPCLVPKNTGLAHVDGVFNAIHLDASSAGEIFVQGRGAGSAPTASAIIADIMDIARGNIPRPFGIAASALTPFPSVDMQALETSYYVRLAVVDKPGVLADITASFRDAGISVKSFIQPGQSAAEKVTIVVATHNTREAELKKALATIAKQPSVVEPPFSIRIEE